jgi:hypothetical protein
MHITMFSALLVAASMDFSAFESLKYANYAESRATQTNIASDDLADKEMWSEYINTTYHFRFQYPQSAKLKDYGSEVDVLFRPKLSNGQEVWFGLSINVFPNTQGLTAKRLALQSVEGKILGLGPEVRVSVLEQGAVKIGGREAYQIKIAELAEEYERTYYEIYSVKGGNAYLFTYDDPGNTAVLSKLVKKLLGSFSFDKD